MRRISCAMIAVLVLSGLTGLTGLARLAGLDGLAGAVDAHAQAQAAPVPATPENAAAFLGDWTLSATGNYGPATFGLTLKNAEGKVVGQISSTAVSAAVINDVSKAGSSLVLRYVFDYQGNPVNALITLTPGENKVDAHIEFADGAATMTGTATKKPD